MSCPLTGNGSITTEPSVTDMITAIGYVVAECLSVGVQPDRETVRAMVVLNLAGERGY